MWLGKASPPTTSIRRNFRSGVGTYTQSRSWICNIALAGTSVCVSFFWPWNVAVANMPMRSIPGLRTSMRTLALRMLGSRDLTGNDLARISVQSNFRAVANVDVRQIVLVHIADNPNVGQVRNRERVRA